MFTRFTRLKAPMFRMPSGAEMRSFVARLRQRVVTAWPSLWDGLVALSKLIAVFTFGMTVWLGDSRADSMDAVALVYLTTLVLAGAVLWVDFWRGPRVIRVVDPDFVPGSWPHTGEGESHVHTTVVGRRRAQVETDPSFRTVAAVQDPRVGARISMYGHSVMVVGPCAHRPSCYVVVCLSGDLSGSRWLADKGWVTRKCRRAGVLLEARPE
ncbi:MAG: hypothetical protein QOH93_3165 [Chloroflexia bacterium]|jgi:hypothetical protein|nr:hypothetical protein [Chloroflexia bacterium]